MCDAGRLAMVAVFGMFMQGSVTHTGPVANWYVSDARGALHSTFGALHSTSLHLCVVSRAQERRIVNRTVC
jgi:hypothetical protein